MKYILIGVGLAVLIALGWYLNRRFGREEPQTHSNVKTPQDHDPMEVAKATFIGIPPAR